MIPDLNRCHFGDVGQVLRTWPDAFVQTVITSPPYLWLRSYDVPPTEWPEIEYVPMPGLPPIKIEAQSACLGQEKSPADFVGHLVHIFREVRRVLRDDGTLWFNMGDSHAGSFGAQGGQGKARQLAGRAACPERQTAASAKMKSGGGSMRRAPGLKEKDLIGVPWRCAFALQADGWYLRIDNIWSKPNPMPESVKDRTAKSHEYFFLLSKSERYFFDHEAIKDPIDPSQLGRIRNDVVGGKSHVERGQHSKGGEYQKAEDDLRNKRTVWTVASYPYKEAHFATFPPKLIQPCILAGTPAAGCCPTCRKPWKLDTEKEFVPQADVSLEKGIRGAGTQKPMDASNGNQGYPRGTSRTVRAEWLQACKCTPMAPIPSICFDPFFGSGTVGQVAQKHGRDFLGCEFNPNYIKLSEKRIADSPIGFL